MQDNGTPGCPGSPLLNTPKSTAHPLVRMIGAPLTIAACHLLRCILVNRGQLYNNSTQMSMQIMLAEKGWDVV